MVQSLQRLREPAAVVLLVVLGLRLLLGLVVFAVDVAGHGQVSGLVSAAAYVLSGTVLDPVTVVLAGVLVGCCLLGTPTRHACTLVTTALALLALAVVASLVADIVFAAAAVVRTGVVGALLGRLLGLVVPVLVLVALARLRALLGRSASAQGALVHPPPAAELEPGHAAPSAAAVEPAAPAPRSEPTWQPDLASGAAWLTAGDAAAGAAATRWGTPGDAGDWVPHADPTAPAPDPPVGHPAGPDRPGPPDPRP